VKLFRLLAIAWILGFVFGLQVVGALAAEGQKSTQDTSSSAKSWTLENPSLRVEVDAQNGSIAVLDKRTSRHWKQLSTPNTTETPRFRNVRSIDAGRGLAFEAEFGWTRGKPNLLQLTLSLSAEGSDLSVTADVANRNAEIETFPFLDPFVLDAKNGVLAVAHYSNGYLYPLDVITKRWMQTSRLDMPWVGMCDLDRGDGYMMLVETDDDGAIKMEEATIGNRTVEAPRVFWTPSLKKFGYARKVLYHFSSQGNYVAMAKRYRAYVQQRGLIVTLAEKATKNPNITRLFGAPDVWGDCNLAFAREAKAAGVEKMLIHTTASGQEIRDINALGYLTSVYDNYCDAAPIEPGKEVDSQHDRVPENIVLNSDGNRMKAWLTWDKKIQYMKRCPTCWIPAADKVITKALRERPYLARFLDVTTAEDLYECYDPNHPLTRGQKRECGEKLLALFGSKGLVTGGEHGIWWAVPNVDYIEGMMSGNYYFSWPAGYLLHPKSKDQEFTYPEGGKMCSWKDYEKYGIGHASHVPLWELVFHDCVVSTWYWGDSSDFLLQAAPEITPKKDAFNILYGTIPMLWANKEGSWPAAREVFLQTYRNTCKLHEVIAGTEMLTHEFVTADRAVQRSRFSDGTETIVNFGDKPREVELAGKKYQLPQNGFVAKGPKIEQSRVLVDGKIVTTIHAGNYRWTDGK
jgi:hypothetical protein